MLQTWRYTWRIRIHTRVCLCVYVELGVCWCQECTHTKNTEARKRGSCSMPENFIQPVAFQPSLGVVVSLFGAILCYPDVRLKSEVIRVGFFELNIRRSRFGNTFLASAFVKTWNSNDILGFVADVSNTNKRRNLCISQSFPVFWNGKRTLKCSFECTISKKYF